MSLFDSLMNLANETGFSPDAVLWVFGFAFATYWVISLIGCGLCAAIWIKVFGWFRYWLSKRNKPHF